MAVKSIETQNLSEQKQFKDKLLQVLAQCPNGLTKNEMVLQSGINNEIIDYVIRGLLNQYPIHLEMNEHHEVRYVFDLSKPKYSDLSQTLKPFCKILSYAGYLLVFTLAILVALVWTLMAFPLIFSILGIYLGVGLFQVFFNQGIAVGAKEYLIYWLGQPDNTDHLEDEQDILYFLSQREYCFCLAELIAHMNWDYQKTSNEALGLLINYGGEIIVDEDGMILYDFSNLRNQDGSILPPKKTTYMYKSALSNDEKADIFSSKKWYYEDYKVRKIYLLNYFNVGVMALSTLILAIVYYRYFSGQDAMLMTTQEEFATMSK
jgi:hypothetical protein